jgi:hypothetical protein
LKVQSDAAPGGFGLRAFRNDDGVPVRRRFEPQLRRIASHEIDTSLPIRDVVETILKLQ